MICFCARYMANVRINKFKKKRISLWGGERGERGGIISAERRALHDEINWNVSRSPWGKTFHSAHFIAKHLHTFSFNVTRILLSFRGYLSTKWNNIYAQEKTEKTISWFLFFASIIHNNRQERRTTNQNRLFI